MAKGLTYTLHISINGAEPVPMDTLSAEEKAHCLEKMSERLSANMSAYYTQHPEEFERL